MSQIKLGLISDKNSDQENHLFEALDKEKYEIFRYDPNEDLIKLFIDASTNKFDIVFPALHGTFGEDGSLQGMFDLLKVPYIFSGILASSISMNKYTAKLIVKSIGINTAKDLIVKRGEKVDTRNIISLLSLPLVVKPMEQGSSIGVSIVHTKEELEDAVAKALEHGKSALLESYIKGREFTVAVIGNEMPDALPVIEIIPTVSTWFDYKSKYEDGGADEICPAVISDEVRLALQNISLDVYKKLGCRDLARVDLIMDSSSGIIYFIEINTIPGMTKNSLAPKAAKEAGISFSSLLDRIIEGAIEDRKKNN